MSEHDGDSTEKHEVHRRRTERLEATSRIDLGERERIKELHWMCCPKCGCELDEITFRGVKVDKCFSCGGVYLDDGELEQLAGKGGFFEALRYYFR